MNETYVGLDVHAKSITIAMLLPGGEFSELEIPHRKGEVKRWVKMVKEASPGAVKSCYEAGPTGFGLDRQLRELGVDNLVAAPSLIPQRRGGERIKTDRRDAVKLMKLLKAGMLQGVEPPTPAEEAMRDLCRCRHATGKELSRARHRLSKFLLRRDRGWRRGSKWTKRHRQWLKSQRMEQSADQVTLDSLLWGVERLEEQLRRLEQELEQRSREEPYAEPVGHLRCFRGIDLVTAVSLVSELYGFGRFSSPKGLMNFVGLTPGESSSGEHRRRTGITKQGNGYVRRLLVESSWHYRHRPLVGAELKRRRRGQPAWVVARADQAMNRLSRRFSLLLWRGKQPNKAVVAVARELTGFIWDVRYRHWLQTQGLAAA